jgi:parallel beta-helix repeat protein
MVPLTAQTKSAHAERILISSAEELQKVTSNPLENVELHLLPGNYDLIPTEFIDNTCGNCENPDTAIAASYGLHLQGKNIKIIGTDSGETIIHTNAGYGIYFEDCLDCAIEEITVTGGKRDTSGLAADAAIVVKNGTVSVSNNRLANNVGQPEVVRKTIVGIMGIAGREGSIISITNNKITGNSWDGIALYRGAKAIIENNFIDGVDKATGDNIGGGRGVAVGITWNAEAVIRSNLIKRYWKGIGIFVDAKAQVEYNIIEDIITWGIALWDADKGMPIGKISRNIIYNTGACGSSITVNSNPRESGWFENNIIARTAQNPKYDSPDYYCYQCALALHAVPDNFKIEGNIFFDNRRATEDLPDYDLNKADFLSTVSDLCSNNYVNPFFSFSDFYHKFCANRQK